MIQSKRSPRSFLLGYLRPHWADLIVIGLLVLSCSVVQLAPVALAQMQIDKGLMKGDLWMIAFCALVLVVLTVLRSGLSILLSRRLALFAGSLVLKIRDDAVEVAFALDEDAAGRLGTGYLLGRIEEIDRIGSLFTANTSLLATGIIQALMSFAILWKTNVVLTVAALLPTILLGMLCFRSRGAFHRVMDDAMEGRARLTGAVAEGIAGKMEARLGSNRSKEVKRVSRVADALRTKEVRQTVAFDIAGESFAVISAAISGMAYILCGSLIAANSLTVGEAIASVQYAAKVYSPVLQLANMLVVLQPSLEAVRRTGQFFSQTQAMRAQREGRTCGKKRIARIATLAARDVSVEFEQGDSRKQLVVCSFLDIRRPGLYVIKGPNGSGKTTFAKLLVGLREDYNGSIRVNGEELRDINGDSLRELTAMVMQDPYIYNRSIRENVLNGARVPKPRYDKVMHLTGLDRVCSKLPRGDGTVVGERGTFLSGGECRRIAVARALVRSAQLIIMDEPLANLDRISTGDLLLAIQTIKGDSIVLVIDHTGAFDYIADEVIHLTS